MTYCPDRDANGCVHGIFVLIDDLSKQGTDRDKMETALAGKERLLSELVETAPSLVVLTDAQGRIVLFNRACEELTGYRRDEVLGSSLLDRFVPAEWVPVVAQRFADPTSPNVRRPHENPWLTRSGEQRTVEWRFATLPVDGNDDLGVLGIGVDITERKAAERVAYQEQAELARVLRVNTMGEMAAALAHELNQPLSAILSYTQGCQRLVEECAAVPADVVGYLDKVADQARRAGEIVRHIRRFIQKDEPVMTTMQINDVVHEAAAFISGEAALQHVNVVMRLQPGNLPVRVERIAIEQVILNLFHNSVEALVSAGCTHREITILTRAEGEAVVVCVQDTGPGVSENLIERIFQPFVTSKRNGLGLGLAICRSIVHDHGGELWLARGDGQGASFCLSLPLTKTTAPRDG